MKILLIKKIIGIKMYKRCKCWCITRRLIWVPDYIKIRDRNVADASQI